LHGFFIKDVSFCHHLPAMWKNKVAFLLPSTEKRGSLGNATFKPGRKDPAMINLRFNYPLTGQEFTLLQSFAAERLRPEWLDVSPAHAATAGESEVLGKALRITGHLMEGTTRVVTCSSGNSAIYNCLWSLAKEVETIGMEESTYQGMLYAAGALGLRVEPLACDQEGLLPDAVEEAARSGLRVLYLQPTIHNPTTRTMGPERRKALCGLARRYGLLLIEDDAYRFLHPAPPPAFIELLPEQTIHIYSLSKPFSQAARLCYLLHPKDRITDIDTALTTTGSGASLFARAFGQHLLESGAIDELSRSKQEQARSLQQRLQPELEALRINTVPTSFHGWIPLPEGKDSVNLLEAAREEGLLVTGEHECIPAGKGSHIRIALSVERDEVRLRGALRQLAGLL